MLSSDVEENSGGQGENRFQGIDNLNKILRILYIHEE